MCFVHLSYTVYIIYKLCTYIFIHRMNYKAFNYNNIFNEFVYSHANLYGLFICVS